MKKVSWFIFLSLLAISCLDEPDCFQLNNNQIGIAFRVMGSTKADTLAIVTLNLSGTDSIFYSMVRTTGLEIPLNFTTRATTVTMQQPTISNFISFDYSTKTQFVSEDCGSRFILENLRITDHNFDSLRLVNSVPGKTASTNVEVYRCPRTNILAVTFRDLYLTSSGTETSRAGSIELDGITTDYSGTVLYDGARLATYYLPVNLEADATTFQFIEPNGASHALTVNYTRTDLERYEPCGVQTFVTNLTIGETDFARGELVLDADEDPRNTLTDPADPNINLYRCPRTNLVKFDFKSPNPASSSGVRTDTVLLKTVKADYTAQVFYTDAFVTTITLPLDENKLTTDFYLEYADRTDTITLGYVKNTTTFVEACGVQGVYSELTLQQPVTGVSITADSLRYPPVTNVQVIND